MPATIEIGTVFPYYGTYERELSSGDIILDVDKASKQILKLYLAKKKMKITYHTPEWDGWEPVFSVTGTAHGCAQRCVWIDDWEICPYNVISVEEVP